MCFSFGGFGNIISIIIFNNRYFQKQKTIVYIQTSFLLSILIIIYAPIMYLSPLWNVSSINCKIYIGILAIINQIKVWIHAISSLDRLISFLEPQKFLFKNRLKYQSLFMFSISLVLILLSLPDSFYFTSVSVKNETICSYPIEPDLRWISIYSVTEYFLFRTMLPFLIMFISSCILSWKIYQNKNQIFSLVERKREVNLFKTLIINDLYILIFQIPAFIQMFQSSSANYFDTLEYSIFFTISLISNVFLFLVFIICNKIYKKLFFKYTKFCKDNSVMSF